MKNLLLVVLAGPWLRWLPVLTLTFLLVQGVQSTESSAAVSIDDEDNLDSDDSFASDNFVDFDIHLSSPRHPSYFTKQWVDHTGVTQGSSYDKDYTDYQWSQRFYTLADYFTRPGSPILVILGGEGPVLPDAQGHVKYPFVQYLAKIYGAFVVQIEHRFYGASQPILSQDIQDARDHGKLDPRVALLTPDQALHDAVRLVRFVRDQLGCSRDKFNRRTYCPIVTIGGSYSAFLAATARLRFPYFVDMAYASSAPMLYYAQQVDNDNAYYDRITKVAEGAVPNCAQAVKTTLENVVAYYQKTDNAQAFDPSKLGVCNGTLPQYIQSVPAFLDEVVMMVGYTFANANMAYYPPTTKNDTMLEQACWAFLSSEDHQSGILIRERRRGLGRPRVDEEASVHRLSNFFVSFLGNSKDATCFDMSAQLPSGPKASISSGDWSGVGTGSSGESWDFQTCTLLVENIAFGPKSMFPPRAWSLEWLTKHCQDRFGNVIPRPCELVEEWQFDHMADHTSRVLFTNGLNDGWSVSGPRQNFSNSVVVLNFPNGAHHSDLSHYPGHSDATTTEDIRQGRFDVQVTLAKWLQELP